MLIAIVLTVGGSGVSAGVQSESVATRDERPSDGRQRIALQDVCGACHGVDVVTGFRSKMEWDGVIESMKSIGADGTKEEFALIDQYILRNLVLINVNTASVDELATALDVAPPVAAAIVKYRSEHRPFTSVGELSDVPGLPAEKVAARKTRLRF